MSSEEESSGTRKWKGPLSATRKTIVISALPVYKTTKLSAELRTRVKTAVKVEKENDIKGRGLFNFGTLHDSCEIYFNNITTGSLHQYSLLYYYRSRTLEVS